MQLFVTSQDPYLCARYLDDKRVIKSILECAQLLSTALYKHQSTGPYKPTHENHPITKWVYETRSNYLWTVNFFHALIVEYQKRFHKKHKCAGYYDWFKTHAFVIPKGYLTPFVNLAKNRNLNIDFTGYKNVHLAYKDYLAARWKTDKLKPRWYGNVK